MDNDRHNASGGKRNDKHKRWIMTDTKVESDGQ